ncbi:MAG TPA: Rnf-Nqr domain containing protein [Candidatus Acidoferrales bacterium]|nr:Rnf-Nqr domain containing protein [Candidatus Acidoferrales bacterium]
MKRLPDPPTPTALVAAIPLAVGSTSLLGGLALGLSTATLYGLWHAVRALLAAHLDTPLRLVLAALALSGLAAIIDRLLDTYLHSLHPALAAPLPLAVAAVLVLEAASSSNTPRTIERIAHWRDLGLLAALPPLIGALREGWATLSIGRVPHTAGGPIPVPEIPIFPVAIWPAGGFILLALLIAGWRMLEARRGAAP